MEYLRLCAIALVGVILILTLERNQKEIGLVLGLVVCCLVICGSITYLSPVIDFIDQLEELSNIDHELLRIVLKAAGISILADIVNLICADSGNASLGKALHMLGISVILWLSIPLFQALIDLLQSVLGEI